MMLMGKIKRRWNSRYAEEKWKCRLGAMMMKEIRWILAHK